MTEIGTTVHNLDAKEKVTGTLIFGADFALPGMLYGAVLRSPHPHANVVSIDAEAAKSMPGVKTVISCFDFDYPLFSVAGVDEVDDRLLTSKARFIGDEIALVAATSMKVAQRAVKKIKVEYEILPAVFTTEEAMAEGAPTLHDHRPDNVINTMHVDHGDVDAAFEECDAIVEATFQTPIVHQGYMEPHAAVTRWDVHGRLTMWLPTQVPRLSQITYANALGIKLNDIHVVQMPIGGGFGGKMEYKLHALCALLSREAGVPVKMINSRREELTAGVPHVPMTIRIRAGCTKEGDFLVKTTDITGNAGAFVGYSKGVQLSATTRHDNLYRIKNIRTDSRIVYTNTIPKGCYRGFGCPQSFFALESIIDMLAEKIGMDPLEFRLKNASQPGDVTPHGWLLSSCGLTETLLASTQAISWNEKRKTLSAKNTADKAYGIGMASCLHVSGNRAFLPYFDGAAAYVRVDEEGYVNIQVGEPDLGQGSRSTFAMFAAHELGIPAEQVTVSRVDTDVSPHGLGTFGDRSTTLTGNAVRTGAIDARNKIAEAVAEELETTPEDLLFEDNFVISRSNSSRRMPFAEAAQKCSFKNSGGMAMGIGHFAAPNVAAVHPDTKVGNVSCAYPFVTQVAEVEVCLKTGTVKVLNYSAAHDLGKTLNPILAEGQVQGAIAQGLGFALTEEMPIVDGKQVNDTLGSYKVPRAHDMPPIRIQFIETDDPNGPYGGKGLAEPALTPVGPAIANAIYNATGVRLFEAPMTPQRVKAALDQRSA